MMNTTQNITLLFISISAIIAISVVGNFVTTYISDVFHGAELQGFADGRMDPEFVEQVKEMEGIEKVLPVYVFKNAIKADNTTISRLEGTDNLEWYRSMLALNFTDKSLWEQAAASFQCKERSVILSEGCLERTNLSVGAKILLSNGTGEIPYTIAASFKSRATVSAFLEPMHAMTWFILLLAAVGVINNLLINYMQKRRMIAIFVSYMEIQTIFLVAAPKISMLPELDLWTFFAAGGLGIFITLLGSIVPIIKSRSMKLVEEIKVE